MKVSSAFQVGQIHSAKPLVFGQAKDSFGSLPDEEIKARLRHHGVPCSEPEKQNKPWVKELFEEPPYQDLQKLREQKQLKVGVVAPPWFCLPVEKYGGIEEIVVKEVKYLLRAGHQVSLFAPTGSQCRKFVPEKYIKNGQFSYYPVLQGPLRFEQEQINRDVSGETVIAGHLDMFEDVLEHARCDEFDILHNHVGYPGVHYGSLMKRFKTTAPPVVTTLHNPIMPKQVFQLHHKVFNIGMPILSIAKHQQQSYRKLNFYANVYNGIDISEFTPRVKPNTGPIQVGFYGRVSSDDKGPLEAILAVKKARERGFDVRLVMAGKINAEEQEFFDQQIKPHLDGQIIKYVGELDHNERNVFLGSLDVLLHLVKWPEPFGLGIVEAMCTGTPVIGTNMGSLPELVVNDLTGKICKRERSEHLNEVADAIIHCRQYDRGLISEITRRRFPEEKMNAGIEKALYGIFLNDFKSTGSFFGSIANKIKHNWLGLFK